MRRTCGRIAAKNAVAVAKAPGARELLARLRKFRGKLPATFKFDRLEANERRECAPRFD
jgi:antitoxin MazE